MTNQSTGKLIHVAIQFHENAMHGLGPPKPRPGISVPKPVLAPVASDQWLKDIEAAQEPARLQVPQLLIESLSGEPKLKFPTEVELQEAITRFADKLANAPEFGNLRSDDRLTTRSFDPS